MYLIGKNKHLNDKIDHFIEKLVFHRKIYNKILNSAMLFTLFICSLTNIYL